MAVCFQKIAQKIICMTKNKHVRTTYQSYVKISNSMGCVRNIRNQFFMKLDTPNSKKRSPRNISKTREYIFFGIKKYSKTLKVSQGYSQTIF